MRNEQGEGLLGTVGDDGHHHGKTADDDAADEKQRPASIGGGIEWQAPEISLQHAPQVARPEEKANRAASPASAGSAFSACAPIVLLLAGLLRRPGLRAGMAKGLHASPGRGDANHAPG